MEIIQSDGRCMILNRIKLTRTSPEKVDTIFYDEILKRVVLQTTVPAFFAFNILFGTQAISDMAYRLILFFFVAVISGVLPFIYFLKNKKFIPITQKPKYYFRKFLSASLVSMCFAGIYIFYDPSFFTALFIYEWILLPILIPYAVVSMSLYAVFSASALLSQIIKN